MKRRTVCAAMAVGTLGPLAGCASAPPGPIKGGQAVAITVKRHPEADGSIAIKNEALGNGVAVGAGSGILAGGLWGLACGPFAILCVPLGAAAGALTGTAAGALVGVTGALPEDKAGALRDRVARVQKSHALIDELHKHIADRASKYWSVDTAPTSSLIAVEVADIGLVSTRDERISGIVRVFVSVRPANAPASPPPSQKLYEYVGAATGIAAWLDEGDDFIDLSLSAASQQIAAQIVSDLAPR